MSNYYKLIKSVIITETSNKKIEFQNEYSFNVEKKTNTKEIKKAIEKFFLVKVQKVRTINVLPKLKRKGKYIGYTSSYKKAMVKLFPGQKIDIFQ
ncbi:MAG: 50S ribosomal protein L23 [Candidatus Phytoplasma cynodontis]|uniref:50S ribosomal protein L23 n=1 Tax='Cynodon dactylon' phytoplasma TaxID=295320 RepID=UPI001265C7F8|nr:50S ribosomal protein L23 ['Cynodon dactylon' phytoplasma]KAB8122123.1 50S ribosomal protein L23 ['Cynodon dactylon' phytoplasma]WIA07601.1 MAG: 50S ribosomal protein L23 [Candidatus Phytoplasma cynodontis]